MRVIRARWASSSQVRMAAPPEPANFHLGGSLRSGDPPRVVHRSPAVGGLLQQLDHGDVQSLAHVADCASGGKSMVGFRTLAAQHALS